MRQEQIHEEHQAAKKKPVKKVVEGGAETKKGAKASRGDALKKEMDELLDTIEDVLVENAESFVASHIQSRQR